MTKRKPQCVYLVGTRTGELKAIGRDREDAELLLFNLRQLFEGVDLFVFEMSIFGGKHQKFMRNLNGFDAYGDRFPVERVYQMRMLAAYNAAKGLSLELYNW